MYVHVYKRVSNEEIVKFKYIVMLEGYSLCCCANDIVGSDLQ